MDALIFDGMSNGDDLSGFTGKFAIPTSESASNTQKNVNASDKNSSEPPTTEEVSFSGNPADYEVGKVIGKQS